MKTIHVAACIVCMMFGISFNVLHSSERIDLSGMWQFRLDPDSVINAVSAMNDSVLLPGTTDTNKRGTPLQDTTTTTHLSRLYSYVGRAWYRRDVVIPSSWSGRDIVLTLERTKPSEVWIDGHFAGAQNSISTPHRYTLNQFLTAGKHTLAICVDNSARRVPPQLLGSSHAYTEDTQTNWNGIIGRIELTAEVSPRQTSSTQAKTKLQTSDTHFLDNGRKLFLRGRHDACVWPLTGHVAMDTTSWRQYMSTCREYGLNHVRFHSWCPPEAAFVAADEAGIILQPELPFWGDFNENDSLLMQYLLDEGERIITEYGNHPSFAMFALGNELWGSIEAMHRFADHFRQINPHILYTFGSNFYLGYQGVQSGMDYFTTCRVGGEAYGSYDTHVRASFSFADAADGGLLNHIHPNTRMTFDTALSTASIPVISHETGQYQVYPDYSEIDRYTGVLRPYNMIAFRDRLLRAGMLTQAADFHRASGLWAVELYKAEIEMDLRSRRLAGFQLLDLQDYPGQGSAYVGMLNAFLEPKDLIEPKRWRRFCCEIVPMACFDRYCWTTDETLVADVKIANYSDSVLIGRTLRWSFGLATGTMAVETDSTGLLDIGTLTIPLEGMAAPQQMTLALSIDGTDWRNDYHLWVYPNRQREMSKLEMSRRGIIVVDTLGADVEHALASGANVLFVPRRESVERQTVGGLFMTDYWNYRMFRTISQNNNRPVSPGTLGLLCNPDHPLFRHFPTAEHTDWQWFPIVKSSYPLVADSLATLCGLDNASLSPTANLHSPVIVQVIDNVERNHRLAIALEFRVGRGKLLVCMADVMDHQEYPEARAFVHAVVDYMCSDDFQPAATLDIDALRSLMSAAPNKTAIDELHNISYD